MISWYLEPFIRDCDRTWNVRCSTEQKVLMLLFALTWTGKVSCISGFPQRRGAGMQTLQTTKHAAGRSKKKGVEQHHNIKPDLTINIPWNYKYKLAYHKRNCHWSCKEGNIKRNRMSSRRYESSLRVAVVCSSNMNRSMEAHSVLQKKVLDLITYQPKRHFKQRQFANKSVLHLAPTRE